MTTTDWIIDITLVLIVLRQVREARIDRQFVLIPAAIVAFTASKYLHAIPTAGNDLVLITICVAVGTALGVAGGLTTHVRVVEGQGYARAGVVAATLWVASMGARLAFIVWASHPAGAADLGRFSMAHHTTGADAWQDALVLLALSEVVVRLGLIVARSYLLRRRTVAADNTRQLVTA
ncbi:hypothetical protein [uncultured Jatrophihabitans sp.]|uniref:hypothetical protein n=1 Tax=uncultured Jatrophihabitans sp. TaxID=1610747 RepID=UPI0035CAF3A8